MTYEMRPTEEAILIFEDEMRSYPLVGWVLFEPFRHVGHTPRGVLCRSISGAEGYHNPTGIPKGWKIMVFDDHDVAFFELRRRNGGYMASMWSLRKHCLDILHDADTKASMAA